MIVGIIAPMKIEMEEILNRIDNLEEYEIMGSIYNHGYINNCEVVLVESGIGKVNVAVSATILIREFNCNFIINTGIAGGTKPLHHRDVIIAESFMYHDFDLRIFKYSYGQVPGMPKEFMVNINNIVLVKSVLNKMNISYKTAKIYSGDQFVTSMDKFENMDLKDGIACEMEGASIAQVCIKAGIDFIGLRYISDIIGEENQEEEYFKFETDMAHMSANICIKLIENLE